MNEQRESKCDICRCEHDKSLLTRIGFLYLKGSEDDFICPRCREEISKFARSLQRVIDKVRFSEIDKIKARELLI